MSTATFYRIRRKDTGEWQCFDDGGKAWWSRQRFCAHPHLSLDGLETYIKLALCIECEIVKFTECEVGVVVE